MMSFAVPVFAEVPPIVQCGTTYAKAACTLCDILVLVKNVVDFVTYKLTPVVAAILIMFAGILTILNVNIPIAGEKAGYAAGMKMLKSTIIGVIIVYCAWLLTNTFIQIVAGKDNHATSWFNLECKDPVNKDIEVAPGPSASAQSELCNNPKELAAKFNTAYPAQNDKEVTDLISCIKAELPGVDLGREFTIDENSPLCNYTRGQNICGKKCSHTINSCHYGGAKGTTGARAVDFANKKDAQRIVNAAKSDKCWKYVKSARCEDNSGNILDCSNDSRTHVHISTKSCDKS